MVSIEITSAPEWKGFPSGSTYHKGNVRAERSRDQVSKVVNGADS